ncbi:MAG: hypothetical protein NWE76_02705 [Candidatus Bathyarchaeota archaeon]|nr:hypothetical protein [Candidatus Bathyarchaeota archaeon]
MGRRKRDDGLIWNCGRKRTTNSVNRWSGLFGAWLRRRRHDMDMSLDDMADSLNLVSNHAKTGVSKLECGKIDPYKISVERFVKYMLVYKIKPEAALKRLNDIYYGKQT